MTPAAAALPGASGEKERALLRASLDALARRPKDGPAWLEALRDGAAAWLGARGFPTQREEAFRFLPLQGLLRASFETAAAGAFERTVEGGAGLEVRTLREVLRTSPERVEPYLGRIAEVEDGFAALGAALVLDGLVVFARKGSHGTLHVTYPASAEGERELSLPRLLVVAEPGSELSLFESYGAPRASPGEHLTLAVTEVFLGEGASVDHARLLDGGEGRSTLATLAVRQSNGSRYASRVFDFGGKVTRLDLRVALHGERAECTLDGFYHAGAGEIVDHHTTIDHLRPRCTSRERYKGVLDGNGTAIFDGTIHVRPGAFGTAAHQENRNLLLSGDAVVHTKPHLRIDADDVKCSHGATVGTLDPAQLFYLRSRGMGPDLARDVLTAAFAREIVETVPSPAVRRQVEARLSTLFPDGMLDVERVP